MKDWQYGYELDYLLELEKRYASFNKFSQSPFSSMKKNVIAAKLHNGELRIYDNALVCVKEAKVASNYNMFPGVLIGTKLPGDIIFSKIVWEDDRGRTELCNWIKEETTTYPSWIEIWQEDPSQVQFALDCGYIFKGSKITTFGEIIGIYFKDKTNVFFGGRDFPELESWNFIPMLQFNKVCYNVDSIAEKVKNLYFANHYSNYNSGNSWGALCLRGYDSDPSMIAKPSEMNDKWLSKNKDKKFFLQDTELYNKFPEVRAILDEFPGEKHRIRFMRLTPGGGELERHTDQVDKESGLADGRLLRLHIPIITNPEVQFITWNAKGEKLVVNPKIGESWSLNTMFPHMVINGGTTDRIHLVTDIVSSPELRKLWIYK